MTVLLISIGGALWALSRYFIAYIEPFSSIWAIVLINAIGSFIMGLLFKQMGSQLWLFAAIGFCGAFTTFSTYSLETIKFISSGAFRQLAVYMIAMNALSVAACWVGFKLTSN
jgi:CrcB protein